jgi:hypothetical protein
MSLTVQMSKIRTAYIGLDAVLGIEVRKPEVFGVRDSTLGIG